MDPDWFSFPEGSIPREDIPAGMNVFREYDRDQMNQDMDGKEEDDSGGDEDTDDDILDPPAEGIEWHVERILEKQGIYRHRGDWLKPENIPNVQAAFQTVQTLRGKTSEGVARNPLYWDDYNEIQELRELEEEKQDEEDDDSEFRSTGSGHSTRSGEEEEDSSVDSVDELEDLVSRKHRVEDAVEQRRHQHHKNTSSSGKGNINNIDTADTSIAPDGRDRQDAAPMGQSSSRPGGWRHALNIHKKNMKKKKKRKKKHRYYHRQELPVPLQYQDGDDGNRLVVPEGHVSEDDPQVNRKRRDVFIPDDFNEQRIQQELQPLGLQLFEHINDKSPIGVQWERIVEAYHDKLGIFMFVGEQESGKTFACKQYIAEKLKRNPTSQVIILCPGGSDEKKWGDKLHRMFNRVPIRHKIYDKKQAYAPRDGRDDDEDGEEGNWFLNGAPVGGGDDDRHGNKKKRKKIELPERYIEVERVRLYEDNIQTRLLAIIELQKQLYEAYREGRLDYPPTRLSIVLDDCLGLINMERKGVKDAFDTVAGAARHVNCNVDLFILAQEINFFRKSIRGNCGCLFMFKCSDNQVPMLTQCQSIHTEKELKFWKDRCCQQNQFLFYPRKYQPFVYLSKAQEFQKTKK